MWRQSRRLKLFWFLWLPAACFGQDIGGSRVDSNPLNAYAPPCISQVKPKHRGELPNHTDRGYATIQLCVYWRLPCRDVYVHGFGRWLDQWDAHRDNWCAGHSNGNRCKGGERSNCFHDYASRIDGHRSLRERHLRHGLRLCDQNGCRLYDQIVNHASDDSHGLLE
jgi:hypothetical protein